MIEVTEWADMVHSIFDELTPQGYNSTWANGSYFIRLDTKVLGSIYPFAIKGSNTSGVEPDCFPTAIRLKLPFLGIREEITALIKETIENIIGVYNASNTK